MDVRSGQRSAEEVTRAALAAAERLEPHLGAFARLSPELALEQARAVDERIAAAHRAGRVDELATALPLAGVPCPIKDLNQVAGVPMTAGAALLAADPIVPEADDGSVTALREAGTTMIGKTSTPEFGFPPYTEPNLGPGGAVRAARTPWDLTRGAGGSSGGAAAAVAAGIVPIAHASDGGGSIRIPAAACGIVGYKPSAGLVSNGPTGVAGAGLATQGVVARTVLDSAIGTDVLSRAWPGDAPHPARGVLAQAVRDVRDTEPVRGLRVGLLTDPVVAGDAMVHPESIAAATDLATLLESLGADVVPVPVPFTPQEWLAFMPLWSVGAVTLPIPPEADPALTPLTRWLRERGRSYTGAQYAEAVMAAQRVARQTAAAWDAVDVVLTPSLAGPPAPVGSLRDDADPAGDFEDQKRFTPWTSIANIAGTPSISLPVHTAVVDGVRLPFGAMLTGRPGGDARLLEIARAVEVASPFQAPPAWPDAA